MAQIVVSPAIDAAKRAHMVVGEGPAAVFARRPRSDYIWTIGRTSIAPTLATGHLAAYATASSRSLASIT